MTENKFEVNLNKSLGGVNLSMTPVNGVFGNFRDKMADFLLELSNFSKRLFCSS